MNIDPNKTEKEFNRDLRTFERLPDATKELEILRDLAEKAIGPDNVTLTETIQDKVDQMPLGQTAEKREGETQQGTTP